MKEFHVPWMLHQPQMDLPHKAELCKRYRKGAWLAGTRRLMFSCISVPSPDSDVESWNGHLMILLELEYSILIIESWIEWSYEKHSHVPYGVHFAITYTITQSISSYEMVANPLSGTWYLLWSVCNLNLPWVFVYITTTNLVMFTGNGPDLRPS